MLTPEEYVSALPVGKDAKRKALNAIKDMQPVLAESGHEWPDASDYEEYRRRSRHNESGTEQNVSRVEKYYRALRAEGSEQLLIPETADTPTQPEPACVERKSGRKCLDTENGEVRSEKLMIYLTPSMIADVRDWCSLKRISCVSYITGLISADLAGKQEKLKFFRELSEGA